MFSLRDTDFLVPPRSVESAAGVFSLPASLCIADPDSLLDGTLIAWDWQPSEASDAHVLIGSDAGVKGIDGYRLRVTPDLVTIDAACPAAVLYAFATLAELYRVHGSQIPCGLIADSADFVRRGVYLDCSRGKVPTLDTLDRLIEQLASWKVNELQLYVKNVFAFEKYPEIGEGFSPFTAADIRHLRENCAKHCIRLVGSIAGFSHMEPILALPRFRPLSELPEGNRDCPGGTTLCPADPGAIALLDDLYAEFVPLFDAVDFNVCGDEPWELGQGRSAQMAEKVGKGRLYADFMKQIHDLIANKYHKRMNMWGDVVCDHPEVLDDISRDIVMLNWDYNPEGNRFDFSRKIRDAGFPLVICPGTNSWQTHGGRMAPSMKNIAGFAAVGRQAGAEGLLNTDWGDCGHRNSLAVSLHGLAYGAACAWNATDVNDETFTRRVGCHVFGIADSAFADALRRLGSNCPSTPTALYHILITPIHANHEFLDCIDPRSPVRTNARRPAKIFDAPTEDELQAVIELWEHPPFERCWSEQASANSVSALSLRQLDLAARMDRLAARKTQVVKRIRANQKVDKSECANLGGEIREMAETFKQLWLQRNRPSRLDDNLELMRLASQELIEANSGK
ncbi:MAG: family 20 glycosylhydrolase [Verrucomicrobiota bacterium]